MNLRPSKNMVKVREARPLVHHITNYVTVNDCANICICAGGSPVMTDGEDVAEMVSASSATVLNIGTLNGRTVALMEVAAETAKACGVPMVLDPVGAGATAYRTEVSGRLMAMGPAVIKGNAGEISVLSGTGGVVKGVDSKGSSDSASAAKSLAEATGAVVVATGLYDYVSDGETTLRLRNGTSLMERVSGTGCMLSSVVGCYVGACGRNIETVAAAVSAFNVAAEEAFSKCTGPGTFRDALMDSMFHLDPGRLDQLTRCDWI